MRERMVASLDSRWLACVRDQELQLYDLQKGAQVARAALRSLSVDLGFISSEREQRLLAITREEARTTLQALALPTLADAAAACTLAGRLELSAVFHGGALLVAERGAEEPEELPTPIAVLVAQEGIGYNDWPATGRDYLTVPVVDTTELVVSIDEEVLVVDAMNGRPLRRLKFQRSPDEIRSLGFCRGPGGFAGRCLWIAGADGILDLFRFSDGRKLTSLKLGSFDAALSHPAGDVLGIVRAPVAGRRPFDLVDLTATTPFRLTPEVRGLCVLGGRDPHLVVETDQNALLFQRARPAQEDRPRPLRTLAEGARSAGHSIEEQPGEEDDPNRSPEPEDPGLLRGRESGGQARVRIVETLAAALTAPKEDVEDRRAARPRRQSSPLRQEAPAPPDPAATLAADALWNGSATARVARPREPLPLESSTADYHSRDLQPRAFELLRRGLERRAKQAAAQAPTLMPDGPWPDSELIADFQFAKEGALARLAELRQLSPTEMDLMALLFVCATDSSVAPVIEQLLGMEAPTTRLAFELIYRPRFVHREDALRQSRAETGAHGRLRRMGYLLVEGERLATAAHQILALHPRVIDWLAGNRALDPALAGIAALRWPDEAHRSSCQEGLTRITASLRQGGRIALVRGPIGVGRELLVHEAAAQVGRPLLVLNGRLLDAERLVAGFREASLQDALLAIREADEAFEGELAMKLRELLEVGTDTVALLSTDRVNPAVAMLRPVTEVQLEIPGAEERLELWRAHLGSGLEERDLFELASLYNVGLGAIAQASLAARELAACAERPLERRDIKECIDQLFHSDLAGVALHQEVTQRREDLVLSPELDEAVDAIIDRVRLRAQVLGSWGFDRKLGKGLGLLVLLSGQPGTGKSMTASIVAKELGLDLYVIDLSQITSKWIGETEKNLKRAFDAAEAGHVLLLFDEADSLLGKRTSEVQTANDRYANLGTNFILARLEQFRGVAFFTTNKLNAIDAAVSRRMSLSLQFPFPDGPTRTELWRRMIPERAPLAPDVDFVRLGEDYKLSGGVIRNIVVRAAFAAAKERQPIAMRHLLKSVEREYHDRGRTIVGGMTELC